MIEFENPSQSLFDRQSQSDRVRDEPDLLISYPDKEEPRPGMTTDTLSSRTQLLKYFVTNLT